MTKVNVSRLLNLDPMGFSTSIAESGPSAGPDSWNNAKAEATARPLLDPADHDAVRKFFAGFGAWEREEIAAWSVADLDALVLQYAAGDLREVQNLCPGDGLGEIDWTEAEKLAEAGTIGGRLYASGDDLMIYIGD